MAYPQPPKKTGLPREVLKWLQSLDLSFSLKNVRRDFSNGYLVAEIFSWYYPEDFAMHSYDKGTSFPAKQGNWSQIERFLQKQNIDIMKEVIDGTIHCKPGAAELLVQEIYTTLTKRRVKGLQDVEVDFTDRDYQEQLPMVARSTASKAIKNNLKITEIMAEPNINTNQRKVEAIIHRHLERRAVERLQNPQYLYRVPILLRTPSPQPSDAADAARRRWLFIYTERFQLKPSLGQVAVQMSLPSRQAMCPSSLRSGATVPFKEVEVLQPGRRSLVYY